MDNKKRRILIVDGNQLVWRVVGTSPLEEPRHLAGRFLRWVSVIPRYHGTQKTFIAWDVGKSFRRELFSGYKAKRRQDPMQEAIRGVVDEVIKMLIPILKALGITQVHRKGYEADDVIYSLAIRQIKKDPPDEVIVYSMDADLEQLIRFDGVYVLHPTGKPLGREFVKRKRGVEPEMVQTLKALAGDSSDNYIGVRGIGPKKAVKLINDHGDLFKILEAAEKGEVKGKMGEKIIEERESALLAWKLAALQMIEFKENRQSADRDTAQDVIMQARVKEGLDPEVFESLIEE